MGEAGAEGVPFDDVELPYVFGETLELASVQSITQCLN
jgi:hypothetical protein